MRGQKNIKLISDKLAKPYIATWLNIPSGKANYVSFFAQYIWANKQFSG